MRRNNNNNVFNNESGAMECLKQKVTSFWIKCWLFLGKAHSING